jgi:hypothetical protein
MELTRSLDLSQAPMPTIELWLPSLFPIILQIELTNGA